MVKRGAVLCVVAIAALVATATPASAAGTVTVTPSTGLQDGDVVSISGGGFSGEVAGQVDVYEARYGGNGVDPDIYTVPVFASSSGFTISFQVSALEYNGASCLSAGAMCYIVVDEARTANSGFGCFPENPSYNDPAVCPFHAVRVPIAFGLPASPPHEFLGFLPPLPKSMPVKSGSTLPVKFRLAVSDAEGSALASGELVRASLTGPGISTVFAPCTYDLTAHFFQCNIKTPRGLQEGAAYAITAEEKTSATGSFVTAPPVNGVHNPETIFFK